MKSYQSKIRPQNGEFFMNVTIQHTSKNATPEVIRALTAIKAAGGGELHFEAGEYHFYKEGTQKAFFAVSNNTANDKYIVFPILDMENIVVDGHGSVFVFHEVVFPFMVSHSKDVIIRNINVDLGMSPLVNFKIHDITSEGFYMDIDREQSPFFIENGSICFKRESEIWYGSDLLLSLHSIGRHQVQYLATGACCLKKFENLPAPLIKCDVSETPTGIYARYREDTPSKCGFGEEMISAIIDGGRKVDVVCLDRSENINMLDFKVTRGIGMGIIGQLSRNILIDSFSTNTDRRKNGHQSLTADALHFVNCDGKLEIRNCVISDTMDDAINVHGMYTVLSEASENELKVSIMHREQHFFNPYREGDRLTFIDPQTYNIEAEFIVDTASLNAENGTEIVISGRFTYGFENVKKGFLIENPDRMPDLHLHHNDFDKFPHNRISGAGEILVEENRFSNCHAALLCLDLAQYWYESGRVSHLVYRNNILKNCDITGNGAFIIIGIGGFLPDAAPKVHGRIEITGNHFSEIACLAIKAGGVRNLVLDNNVFETEKENFIASF